MIGPATSGFVAEHRNNSTTEAVKCPTFSKNRRWMNAFQPDSAFLGSLLTTTRVFAKRVCLVARRPSCPRRGRPWALWFISGATERWDLSILRAMSCPMPFPFLGVYNYVGYFCLFPYPFVSVPMSLCDTQHATFHPTFRYFQLVNLICIERPYSINIEFYDQRLIWG